MTGQIKAQNSALDAVAPSHGIIKNCIKTVTVLKTKFE